MIFTLLSQGPYINLPQNWLGWIIWFFYLFLNVWLLYYWYHDNSNYSGDIYRAENSHRPQKIALSTIMSSKKWLLFAILCFVTPFTTLFIGVGVGSNTSVLDISFPSSSLPIESYGLVTMLLFAVPWMLAGGFLGPLFAALIGLLAGILTAFWQTHNLFTPLITMLLAILFAVAVRQPYRTSIYKLLRQPVLAALLLVLLYPLIYLSTAPFMGRSVYQSNLSTIGHIATYFTTPFVLQLDYALNNLSATWIAVGITLLSGGLLMQISKLVLPNRYNPFPKFDKLLPSPAERSLHARIFYGMAPLGVVLILTLIIGSWFIAGAAGREILRDRMAVKAQTIAKQVPYFMEAGQSIITQLAADPRIYATNPQETQEFLAQQIKVEPFFSQLVVLDESGTLFSAYPDEAYTGEQLPVAEQVGVQMALSGFPFQTFTLAPSVTISRPTTAQLSFIVPAEDIGSSLVSPQGSQQVVSGSTGAAGSRVLVGRVDLADNPFSRPWIESLNNWNDGQTPQVSDGTGFILDENNRVLFHPNPALLMKTYSSNSDVKIDQNPSDDETALESLAVETGADGTRRLVYYQPVSGQPWTVVMSAPVEATQQFALRILLPLLGMILILAVMAGIVLDLGLKMVTGSLKSLANQAVELTKGKLESPIPSMGEDEVGQLSRTLEEMRLGLKSRLDDLNRLLNVSQIAASNLDIAEAVKPVLESALANGGSEARIVLISSFTPEQWSFSGGDIGEVNQHSVTEQRSPRRNEPVVFFASSNQDVSAPRNQIGVKGIYHDLDEQIISLTRQKELITLTSLTRPRLLTLTPGKLVPGSLIAIAIRNEDQYYGALWVAYDKTHTITEAEIRFVTTLANQAALAATNTRLFLNAEIGRQRLEAILTSSPDPILVTDGQGNLILANPSALQLIKIGAMRLPGRPQAIPELIGQPVELFIKNKELLALLMDRTGEKRSGEVMIRDGQVFLAAVSSVNVDGQRVGRVCVLRDVTQFKEQDAVRSEYISTVSHDLRTPLALVRGYATMIEMVGQLNEQQTNYVRKIITGVENMSRLVNNLLDLRRIESGVALQTELISANELVDSIISSVQIQASPRRIQIKAEYSPQSEKIFLEADKALLQQAIQNLVENAIKYNRNEGKVWVRVQLQADRVIFAVSDTGIGIAPMDQPRLFEKFYRGPQTDTDDFHGRGLGLPIVRSIVERHKGEVWVESQLGKGSTFFIAVPLRQTQKHAN